MARFLVALDDSGKGWENGISKWKEALERALDVCPVSHMHALLGIKSIIDEIELNVVDFNDMPKIEDVNYKTECKRYYKLWHAERELNKALREENEVLRKLNNKKEEK